MAKTIEDYLARLKTLIQDPASKLEDADRTVLAKKTIVQVFSKDRPQQIVVEVLGNATSDIDMPAGYIDGFSLISKVEYPVDHIPPTYLEDEQYTVYRKPTGLKLRFLDSQPAAGDKIWVTFTAPHKDDGSTVSDADFDTVCDAMAAVALEVLATKYAGTSDPTISADVVNYRDKSSIYLSLAKAAWARYYKAMGIQAGSSGDAGSAGQAAAVVVGEMTEGLSFGIDRLTHQRHR